MFSLEISSTFDSFERNNFVDFFGWLKNWYRWYPEIATMAGRSLTMASTNHYEHFVVKEGTGALLYFSLFLACVLSVCFLLLFFFLLIFFFFFFFFFLFTFSLGVICRQVRITKTRLYNFDPLKPHFYIVKLGFTEIYIIFLISAQKHRLWVLVRTASPRRF